jgi:intracellular multiplication protein IcmE
MVFPIQNKSALGLALAVLAAVAVYVGLHWEPAIPVSADARAPSVGGVSSVPGGPQTPEYTRLQHLADERRANRAREMGGSAVPTPPELQALPTGEPPAPGPGEPPPPAPRPAAPPARSSIPPPDETDRLTGEFARAMQGQVRQLVAFRQRFEPTPTRMVTFEDRSGQRERAAAHRHAERLLAEARSARPRDRRDLLRPGDILYAVLQTAINSDEPGPVRAKIVGERFKGAILLGELSRFPPVVGSRPERVLVKFSHLTTPDRTTHRIEAYAIDLATARTALATGVDHHTLERWGSLLAASFLEGYGNAVRASHTLTTVGPLGNVVSVPKDHIDHEDIVREALGTVGQRMGGAVAENFQRPNTITVDAGAGLGVLIVAPVSDDREDGQDIAGSTPLNRAEPLVADLPAAERESAESRMTAHAGESTHPGGGRPPAPTGWPTLEAPAVPLPASARPRATPE